ncbi:MAG: hypothetical protein JO107_05455 [Hyphomicrobiales bacterium]|nr:hypothetical protein [Hyphomicrobiales bacterium]MBV8662529.1 hypothetical protein [Hyphomicrobiales bacterium]
MTNAPVTPGSPRSTVDWKHIALGAVAVFLPVELHYLIGLDWNAISPAYASTILGVLGIANEIVSNVEKQS